MSETEEAWVFEPHNGYGRMAPDGEPWPFGYISEKGVRAGLPSPLFELRPVLVEPIEKLTDAALKMAAAPAMYEALSELVDLMQAVIDGDYTPDSFTLQPARAALRQASPTLNGEQIDAG